MKFFTLLISFLIFSASSFGQINAYAKVSALAGTTLTLTNVNQAFHTFAVGEFAVLMQMQDDVIGANTADNINFGDLSTIASAGLYEIRQIISINGNTTPGFTSLTPTAIVLNNINHTYNVNPNSSLQLISFRQMSTGNYATTANITALNWNGNIGGVIAFEVPDTLILNHNIIANNVGFRGGLASTNNVGVYCQNSPFTLNNSNLGFKGEGIYKSTNTMYNNARAKIINGGGGGLAHNGGGGGGGNFTQGGTGGIGNNCTTAGVGFGYGGLALAPYITGNRIFMGGGGGGGHQNNGFGTNGGNGGGIILIKADAIQTTGSCAGRIISANGFSPPLGGNDGCGGGGAAGSIVFFVNTWNINATCNLTIQANGGSGSTVNSPGIHGAGGAGGQGVIFFNGPVPAPNVNITTLNGSAGCNDNSNPCTSFAGVASGSNNAGITGNATNPLPIELLNFTATVIDDRAVLLLWQTASETNNAYFTVERSKNGTDWDVLQLIEGAGNATSVLSYSWKDSHPLNDISYYRLKQTDFDGHFTYSPIKSVNLSDFELDKIHVFPNPTEGQITISGTKEELSEIRIYNTLGQDISTRIPVVSVDETTAKVDLTSLGRGIYFIQTKSFITKVIRQ